MDLSFEEKSAWGSLLAVAVASWLFFPVAISHIAAGGDPIDLIFRALFVVAVIIGIEVVYHVFTAVTSRDRETDERDAMITLKADSFSGYVLAFAVFWIVGLIVVRSTVPELAPAPSNIMVAIYLLLALTGSEASKLAAQIWHYRTGS